MRIRSVMPRLPEASLKVARQVLDDSAAVMTSSIAELAKLCGTSQASVTRFCQALGLSGYPELRLRLAAESGRAPELSWELDLGVDIGPDDSTTHIATVLASTDIRAIQRTLELLEAADLEPAASAIVAARRVNIYGAGGSALVAQELQFRLSRLGLAVWSHVESHAALMAAALMRPGDVFFAVSRSGRTTEAIEALAEAKDRGAMTIALTSFPNSPLGVAADIVLTTPVEDTSVRHGSLAARYAQLLMIDCVYTAVAQRTYEISTEALTLTSRALASHRSSRRSNRTKRSDE